MATLATHRWKLLHIPIAAIGLCLAVTSAFAADGWIAGEPIQVVLADGRVVLGAVAPATDAVHLWLDSRDDGAVLSSRFPWSAIVAISQGEAALDIERLRTAAVTLFPPDLIRPVVGWDDLPPPPPVSDADVRGVHVSRRPLLPAPPRVESLSIETRLANWDADALPDGLLVTIYPLTPIGDWTAVRGTLDLTLLAEVWPQPTYPPDFPRSNPPEGFYELARASHLVREFDFARGPATFRLPFRRYHPEFATQIATYGIVHARLGVNGQGVFEATESFQRLRQPSPTRDRLQLFRGQRFFPIENPPYRP